MTGPDASSPAGAGPAPCVHCGGTLPAGARFCPSGGQRLGAPLDGGRLLAPDAYLPPHLADRLRGGATAIEGERKQVTVMFADVQGSMELLADRDPEDASR